MATPRRRVGSESSETRHALLDAVERLMATEGYAAVS
jgi:AcrR family transcriptional regulator